MKGTYIGDRRKKVVLNNMPGGVNSERAQQGARLTARRSGSRLPLLLTLFVC